MPNSDETKVEPVIMMKRWHVSVTQHIQYEVAAYGAEDAIKRVANKDESVRTCEVTDCKVAAWLGGSL